jgi:hypothetical protein
MNRFVVLLFLGLALAMEFNPGYSYGFFLLKYNGNSNWTPVLANKNQKFAPISRILFTDSTEAFAYAAGAYSKGDANNLIVYGIVKNDTLTANGLTFYRGGVRDSKKLWKVELPYVHAPGRYVIYPLGSFPRSNDDLFEINWDQLLTGSGNLDKPESALAFAKKESSTLVLHGSLIDNLLVADGWYASEPNRVE